MLKRRINLNVTLQTRMVRSRPISINHDEMGIDGAAQDGREHNFTTIMTEPDI